VPVCALCNWNPTVPKTSS